MDWSRESNRQQCQQATPTGPAPHCATLCHTVPHCTTLHHTAPHCTTLHHTVPHCVTMYHNVPHCITQCGPHYATLCHTVLHCATLYHTVPHCVTTYFHSFSTVLRQLFCTLAKFLISVFILLFFTWSCKHFYNGQNSMEIWS